MLNLVVRKVTARH